MRVTYLGLSGLTVVVLLATLVVSGPLAVQTPSALAQDSDDQCQLLASAALSEASTSCEGLGRGEICLGHPGANAIGVAGGALATVGDTVLVSEIDSLMTMSANAETGDWGIVEMKLSAGLPDDSAVTAVMFGNAQIAQPVEVTAEHPTMTIFNRGSAPINLRNGAAITYDLVGQLAAGAEAVADGRNEQADWVRIRFEDTMAWVFTPLVGWDGDQSALMALDVLLPNDVTLPMAATAEPFQSLTLRTGPAGCGAAPSGLLLQASGAEMASLMINQVSLEFSTATLMVTAMPNSALEIKVMAGAVTATTRGIAQEATVGSGIRVTLGGEDGLTAVAAPVLTTSYAFPDVAFVPTALLPGEIACMVGLSDAKALVSLRVGPGEQRGALANMNPNIAYPVIGWANDPDGAPWWELDTGKQTSWAPQSVVRAVGSCDTVAQVEPPPLIFAPGGGAPTGVDIETVADFSPAANSVWQMIPGSDNLSGECSGAPAINFCDHLAAIGPANGGITWRGMEASPYYLRQIQPNVYAYAGPNILGTGRINMTLTFSSDSAIKMTMSLVLNSEPNCTHTYFYSGTKNW